MAERNPLTCHYGTTQGRIKPSVFRCLDGEHVYVLGNEFQIPEDVGLGDYVQISQELDLTGIHVLKIDLGFWQPKDLPIRRDIGGHAGDPDYVPTASLIRSNVFPQAMFPTRIGIPTTWSKTRQPYFIQANSILRVEVNGVPEDINFIAAAPPVGYSAHAVADIINAQAINFSASVEDYPADPYIHLVGTGTGYPNTIEVVQASLNPLEDANSVLAFYQKTAEILAADTAIYGGDNLSAIQGIDCHFTQNDLLKLIKIENASITENNGYNRIVHVLNESTAILQTPIEAEAAGFTAHLVGVMWQFKIVIDSWVGYETTFWPGAKILSNDVGVNVSKLTGVHPVTFRLELIETI
jgi:hypothetical protein